MRKVLLLAAGNPLHRHIDRLRQEGYFVVAVDRDREAEGAVHADVFVSASVEDVDAVTEAAKANRVDVIIAATEAGMRAAASASRDLGLPGLPIETVHAATDKGEMRRRWAAAGLRQPRFDVAATAEEARNIIAGIGRPFVVKPTRSWASKGVSVVMTEPEIGIALADAFAVHGGPVIVEEFVPGRLLSAEGFVSDDTAEVTAIADVEIQDNDRHRVNMALNFPGNFEKQETAEATGLLQRAALALGLRRTPFHAECKVGPHGVELIEMAARGGGGQIFTVLYEPMTGISGIVRQVRLLLDEPVEALPSGPIRGGCSKFLSAPEGILERVEGVEEASRMPGVVDLGIVIAPGQPGGLVTHANARHGYICTIGPNRDEALALANEAARRVRFVMRPR